MVRITSAQNTADPKPGHSKGWSELQTSQAGGCCGPQSDLFTSSAGASTHSRCLTAWHLELSCLMRSWNRLKPYGTGACDGLGVSGGSAAATPVEASGGGGLSLSFMSPSRWCL